MKENEKIAHEFYLIKSPFLQISKCDERGQVKKHSIIPHTGLERFLLDTKFAKTKVCAKS